MDRVDDRQLAWPPLRGSWEEAVLTWNEQIANSFRRKESELGRKSAERRRPIGSLRQNVSGG